jgi:hypothetical protein
MADHAPLTLVMPARIIFAASGAGKSHFLRHTRVGVDGDDVLQATFGWEELRRRRVMADGLVGDIDPPVRLAMSQALHNFSRSSACVVFINGALAREEHSHYAEVEIDFNLNVRQFAHRERKLIKDAADFVRVNRRYNNKMAVDLGAQKFASFDAASLYMDEMATRALTRHNAAVFAALSTQRG